MQLVNTMRKPGMKLVNAVLAVLLLVTIPAAASDVVVDIVDYPEWVWTYSPVIVTAQVTNHGPKEVLVPNGRLAFNRYFVETGRRGETMTEARRFTGTTLADRVVQINPGESWLFQIDVRFRLIEEGRYEIRAGVNGNGRCRLQLQEQQELTLRRLPSAHSTPLYECFHGRVVSPHKSIEVRRPPDSDVNIATWNYLTSPDFPVPVGQDAVELRMTIGWKYLKERFPQSHYTYAAVFYGAKGYRWLLAAQPNHPSTNYTRMKSALRAPPVATEQLPIPQALREFVKQEQLLPTPFWWIKNY